MKNKKEDKNLKNKADDLNLEEILENKRKKKRIIIGVVIAIAIILIALGMTYIHFYGNYKYIRADIKISSSSKLYSNSEPTKPEDIGEGALFIINIEGIKRDDFLAEYEVLEISVNDEQINLEEITYRHLNKALSIRLHSDKYNIDKGNVVIISIREKNSGQIITKRLYHTTEVV